MSSTTTSAPNMIGAINSDDIGLSARLLGRQLATQKRDSLDELGDTLEREQRESRGDQQLHGPAQQPARVAGHLPPDVRLHEHRPREIQDEERRRHEEQRRTEDIDPGTSAL